MPTGTGPAPNRPGSGIRRRSNLQKLLLLVARHRVDLGDDVVGQLLQILLDPVEIVARELSILLELLELLANVATDLAHGDPAVFGSRLHDLHELLAALRGELRKRESDDRAVV